MSPESTALGRRTNVTNDRTVEETLLTLLGFVRQQLRRQSSRTSTDQLLRHSGRCAEGFLLSGCRLKQLSTIIPNRAHGTNARTNK